MPRIFPFEALVYDVDVVGPLDRVTAPPYDVISEERKRVYQAEPFSIVRLDLPGDSDGDGDGYSRGGDLLQTWVAEGALVRTSLGFHAYEMRYELEGRTGRVCGVLCALELEDWGEGVLPHERTMPGPVEDRLRLLRAIGTHLSPVYATVAGPCPDLAELLVERTRPAPDGELIDRQGVLHRRWTISPEEPIASWLAAEQLLIADGHHRYTTALAYRDEMRAAHGPGLWDRLLMFVVDAGSERLPVRPFHRIQLSGAVPTEGRRVGDLATVLAALDDDDPAIGIAVATPDGIELRISALPGDPPAVRALHRELLDALVSPDDLRFTPDVAEAVDAVRAGDAVAAYLLPPTTPERIRKIVGRGERLPQKSTYFWPKPRSGMVLMPLRDPAR